MGKPECVQAHLLLSLANHNIWNYVGATPDALQARGQQLLPVHPVADKSATCQESPSLAQEPLPTRTLRDAGGKDAWRPGSAWAQEGGLVK